MISRVAGTIAGWGREGDYFATDEDADAFEAELTHILLHQEAAFNSPVWFNVGFEEHPQCSACFILSVQDTMESILDWNTKEGMIFRGGSGSGINLSNIRSSQGAPLQGRPRLGPGQLHARRRRVGRARSSPAARPAARRRWSSSTSTIPTSRTSSGARPTRRRRPRALRDAGFDMRIDADGFTSIQYQNANNSVRVTDDFMQAVEAGADWDLTARIDRRARQDRRRPAS